MYKLMNCQCLIKTKVCLVLKVLKRVLGGSGVGSVGVKPIMPLADPVTFLKRFLSSYTRR